MDYFKTSVNMPDSPEFVVGTVHAVVIKRDLADFKISDFKIKKAELNQICY